MENKDIYNKVNNSIPSLLRDSEINHENISFDFMDYRLKKFEVLPRFNIVSKDKIKKEEFEDLIWNLKSKDNFKLTDKTLIINRKDLLNNGNLKQVEMFLANEFLFESVFIEEIKFQFNSLNVKIDFKLEDAFSYLTKVFSIRVYENNIVYENNKDIRKEMFIKKLHVEHAKLKNYPAHVIDILKNSKIVDLKNNINLANLIAY